MPLINRLDITGQLVNSSLVDSGKLSTDNQMTGRSHLPNVLDRTAIHYDTTENWNSRTMLVGERSHIYIYSDYASAEIDGETVLVPAMKIGDGNSYLIDMPFVTGGSAGNVIVKSSDEWAETPELVSDKGTIYVYMDKDESGNITDVKFKIGDGAAFVVDVPFASPSKNEFDSHINNTDVHVTPAEKEAWNNKWRGYLSTAEGENLVFTTN